MLETEDSVIIGIDHGFSFPVSYMARYGLSNWEEFLDEFLEHWPTGGPSTYVDQVRSGNQRIGDASELRFCEQWTATARSVFQFDVRGSVASPHIPDCLGCCGCGKY
ncbi:MAG: hypothetical protein GY703_21900 [Gammaproteobacteria bacterium]|nr:hypothetical protein [Gammaproteobacteria bacterium]